VHELQKERGMSAGYIGSNGTIFTSGLKNQRAKTDREVNNLKTFMVDTNYHEQNNSTTQQLFNNLRQLQTIRQQVDSLSIALPNALRYYTGNNLLILDLNGHLASELEESSSSERFLTLYNIAYAKEQAGIERAVLNNVFASGKFTSALFSRYIELVTKQETYIKSAYTVATLDYKKELDRFVQSNENREVQRYRNITENTESEFNVDPNDWFKAATARIDKLKTTEQTLLNETVLYAQDKVSSRSRVIILESLLLILMLALAYAVFSTIRLRSSQSFEINRFMTKVDSEKDLTDMVEIITELNSRVNDILGMVDVIKSVADQTNLLALNAAIEAARAGEQGRGFAVVADEVRTLAKRTQQSTQEISNVVDVLKTSSQKAFSSIESGNHQAREAVTNAQQISVVLAKIVESIKSVDDVTGVIATSTKEQSSVIQSINNNVASIDTHARETVVGAEQLSASSLQLSQIAFDMEERIKVYTF